MRPRSSIARDLAALNERKPPLLSHHETGFPHQKLLVRGHREGASRLEGGAQIAEKRHGMKAKISLALLGIRIGIEKKIAIHSFRQEGVGDPGYRVAVDRNQIGKRVVISNATEKFGKLGACFFERDKLTVGILASIVDRVEAYTTADFDVHRAIGIQGYFIKIRRHRD